MTISPAVFRRLVATGCLLLLACCGDGSVGPVEANPGMLATSASSLISNPSFESADLSSWNATQGTLSRSARSDAPDGRYVGRVTQAVGNNGYSLGAVAVPSTVAGGAYAAFIYVRSSANVTVGRPIQLALQELTPSGQTVKTWTTASALSTSFKKLAVTATAVKSGNRLELWVTQFNAVNGDAFLVDAAAVTAPASVADGGGADGGKASAPTPSEFPDGSRRVWVHQMIQLPWFDISTPYGADHPLTLQPNFASGRRPTDTAARYVNAGITGIQQLMFEGQPDVAWQVDDLMTITDNSGVEVALCISTPSTVMGTANLIQSYLTAAAAHPSAAKIRVGSTSRSIVFVYGARYTVAPSIYTQIEAELARRGLAVYLIGDVGTAISYNGSFDANRVESWAAASIAQLRPAFDATWTFDDGVDLDWQDMVGVLRQGNPPFAGGMMPAYNRETSADGGYSDPRGTAKYRAQWEDALASGLGWNTVVSWNDVSERHEIWPSGDWNWTRADITAFYSAQLRQVQPPAPLESPQLYVTVPQRINVGQSARTVEALALNGSSAGVTVSVQLVDGAGNAFASPATQSVAAGAAGAATVALKVDSIPIGHFLRARATMSQGQTVLQQGTSAPILVYGVNEQKSGFEYSRVKYRSTPARLALGGSVRLQLTGSPTSGAGTALVTPPLGAAVRFAEVLQNNLLVKNNFANASTPVAVPLVSGVTLASGVVVNTPANGFYEGRIIDEAERVGYSDPVYVP